MSLGAVARVMGRAADEAERMAAGIERAAEATRRMPSVGSSGSGEGGSGSRGPGGAGGAGGPGSGSTGPVARQIDLLEKILRVQEAQLDWNKSGPSGGMRRRLSR